VSFGLSSFFGGSFFFGWIGAMVGLCWSCWIYLLIYLISLFAVHLSLIIIRQCTNFIISISALSTPPFDCPTMTTGTSYTTTTHDHDYDYDHDLTLSRPPARTTKHPTPILQTCSTPNAITLPITPPAPKKNKGQKVDLATFMSEAAREAIFSLLFSISLEDRPFSELGGGRSGSMGRMRGVVLLIGLDWVFVSSYGKLGG
jgi:hypothetical protein